VRDIRAVTESTGNGELVELTTANVAGGSAPTAAGEAQETAQREPFGRFRRRLERIRSVPESEADAISIGGEAELKLQLMLLREENARLKSARHQPASPGSVIDRVRLLSTTYDDGEALDDAWAVLNECLVIREGLDEMCAEILRAIERVRERLALTLSIERAPHEGTSGADGARAFPA
jgi:hypothetical protein